MKRSEIREQTSAPDCAVLHPGYAPMVLRQMEMAGPLQIQPIPLQIALQYRLQKRFKPVEGQTTSGGSHAVQGFAEIA
jgi:hypothetical protein